VAEALAEEVLEVSDFFLGQRLELASQRSLRGLLCAGVTLDPSGSAWNVVSDCNRKENFRALDGEDLLARLRNVPATSWNYIAEGPEVRHIGPMAQDWHTAFGLNADSLSINSGDFDGIDLAAIQALERRTSELRDESRTSRRRWRR
jgi:hypothetical protein